MAATATRRTTRKSTAKVEVPENLKGLVAETDTPAPTKVVRRRRPVAATPAVVVETATDALTTKAAATLLGADGSLTRHTQDYTVDLLDEGTEPDRDYSKVLAKEPSETNMDFVAWVKKYVHYDADPKTVQILISTYKEFQQTPEQKAKTISKRLAALQKRADADRAKAAKAAK